MASRFRHAVPIAIVLLLAAGCNAPDDPGGVAGAEPALAAATTTTTTVAPCEPSYDPLTLDRPPEPTPNGLIELSAAVYSCVDSAVLVDLDAELGVIVEASTRAVRSGVPLLAFSGLDELASLTAELERLEVEEIVAVEPSAGLSATVDRLAARLGIETTVIATTTVPVEVTSVAAEATSTAVDGEPPPTVSTTTPVDDEPQATTTPPDPPVESMETGPAPTTTAPTTTAGVYTPPPGLAQPTSEGAVVVVPRDDPVSAYLLAPAVATGGGEVVAADLADTDQLRRLIGRRPAVPVGPSDATTQWRVELAASDIELFGGGTRVFPDRRIVAYYGNPLTFRLGLLGETDPERAVERVTERARLYAADGLPPVQPGFEIIATVASTSAGDDGDYSNEMDPDILRPWIEAALANDVMVILDLQPGRTDFLTQAQRYEEFLRHPNVGLALDPEWRLEPDQRHLRQIGKVAADEVNAVVDYLTQLVREETLPPKILILHQFKTQMLPDRELIRTPPELAVVVHVDGQGSLGSKYGTWAAMLDAPIGPDQQLWWAWKNFIDEDFPTATPGQVNAVEPLPVIVTYQ